MAETIESEDWQAVPFDEVVVEFLRAEEFKLNKMDDRKRALVHTPAFGRREDNIERRRMLASIRGAIFQRIPPDTRWYLVRSIGNRHLNELLAMGGNCGWDATDRSDRNELMRVAKRYRKVPIVPLNKWYRPILWSHSTAGPFTIFDGVHRFVGHAQRLIELGNSERTRETELEIPVYVGVSQQPCHWHFPDSPVGIYCVNPLYVLE